MSAQPVLSRSSSQKRLMANTDVFFFAAFTGKLQAVQESLESGVDKDVVDKHDQTALYKAASNGHANVVMSLLMAGANVNTVETEHFYTPLHGAAAGGWTTIAHALVKQHARLEALDCDGNTPLLIAAASDCLEVAQYLVAVGANTNARDALRRTPAMVAKHNGFKDLERFLKAHGSLVDDESADSDASVKGRYYPTIKEDQSVSTRSDISESDISIQTPSPRE